MAHRAGQEGVHQDLASSRNWLLDHGLVGSLPRDRLALWLTFVVGVIGYIVKLVHIPVNNILVGGS
jgi:hypothetical protein